MIKPTYVERIVEEHTHAPISDRVDIPKNNSNLKAAATNLKQSTRGMMSTELDTSHTTAINAFPKLESVKRTIRCHQSRGIESCGHPENVSDIIILDKKTNINKGEAFLLLDQDSRRAKNAQFCNSKIGVLPK